MTMSIEKPFIAGNWKMYKLIPEAVELVQIMKEASGNLTDAEIVVIPPFTALSKLSQTLAGSAIQLGSQNIFWEEQGAFTGEISPPMLKDAGCTYAFIGHSERRHYFG